MAKIGFFQEDVGINSSTRLIFIIGSIINLSVLVGMVFKLKVDPIVAATFFGMVESVLCGLKLIQNHQELKSTNKPNKEEED